MNFLNLIPKLLILFQIGLVNCHYNMTRDIVTCMFGFYIPDALPNLDDSVSKNIEDDVAFHLYKKTDGHLIGSPISADEEDLKNSQFNFSLPTIFITHWYQSSTHEQNFMHVLEAFLDLGGFNVITVNWESPWLYTPNCEKVPLVAEYLANFIDFLESHGMSTKNTTLIGHSLGAHIMGIAGSKTKSKINFIVGLDPAAPIFEDYGPSDRLSPDDATTVYVIHTNEGHCGMTQPIGHYDFYPNGGRHQPGCYWNADAHSRAVELFADSIRDNNNLYGRLCSDLDSAKTENCDGDIVQMSGDLRFHASKEGIYHLKTRKTAPFGLGP